MGHFVVSAAVNVHVGKNIKQPAGRGEYRSDTYTYHYVIVADRRRCHKYVYNTSPVSKEGGDVVCV